MILHRATLSGGVVIAACGQIVYFPVLSLFLGILGGATTFFGLRHLQGRLETSWGLLDSCGVLSTFFFPSNLGGIASALVLVGYHYQGIDDKIVELSYSEGIFRINED